MVEEQSIDERPLPLAQVLETMAAPVVVVAGDRRIALANHAALALCSRSGREIVGLPFDQVLRLARPREADEFQHLESFVGEHEGLLLRPAADPLPVWLSSGARRDASGAVSLLVCTLADLSERRRAEVEERRAHRMEAVGSLAAGIAHEINTPIQFVGDTVSFLGDACADIGRVLDGARELCLELQRRGQATDLRERLERLETECDLEFLRAEIPGAVQRAGDGVQRVSRIVKALKEFAHPGAAEKAPADLAAAIETTLAVARNEYKYVAEVEVRVEPIPQVVCHLGDVNQVLLNLIVNAAHAIEERVGSTGGRGHLVIMARQARGEVIISVGDDGCGIPVDARARVFEPFFTTKPAGKGTGQGLALAHRIVVERHGGRLWFETEVGRGTTFHFSLPVDVRGGERAA